MPPGAPPSLEHRVIAEMRIAVDHAEAAERKPPRGEHRLPDAVALGERRVLVREQLGAFEPVEREQPAGRQLRPHVRHADEIGALEHRAIERDVLRLAPVVELLAHARGDLLGDLARVDHRVHAAVDREQPVELLQVGLHGGLHVGILQLGGERLAVERARAMHLAQARRRRPACARIRRISPASRCLAPPSCAASRTASPSAALRSAASAVPRRIRAAAGPGWSPSVGRPS